MQTSSRAATWIAFAGGLAARLLLIATSIGTTDVILKIAWADLASRFGVAHAYAHNPFLNHPPLSLAIMKGMKVVASATGVEYSDIFRLVQVASDVGTFVLLATALSDRALSRKYAMFFFLSPAAIFISGFHCNTDPTMVAFVMLAVWLAPRDRYGGFTGLALGLATGIKIVPLLLTPFFFFLLPPPRRLLFCIAYCATVALIFIPAAVIGGSAVLRNIFGYSGTIRDWGIPGIGLAAGNLAWVRLYARVGPPIVIVAIALLSLLAVRAKSTALPRFVALALLTLLFFAPGFGVQYLVWPLPFLPFALSWRFAGIVSAATSLHLFITYTIWAHGFPWWYADAVTANPHHAVIVASGFVLWMVIGAALWQALRQTRTAMELTAAS